jgi:hypothetical protein
MNIVTASENTPGAVPSMASATVNNKSLKMHWDVGGTNYCKNMEYIGSTLSRFDAHQGLYNGKIIESTVNYMAITGNGKFIVENSRWFAENTGYGSNAMFHLRSDYGSTWEGDIEVNNLSAYVYSGIDVVTHLFYHNYQNWYFGYQACFPSLSMNNVDYYSIETREPLSAGYRILLVEAGSISGRQHLKETNIGMVLSIEDKDEDGYVDYPFDIDGDGIIGNSPYKYKDCYNSPNNGKTGSEAVRYGWIDSSGNTNLNPIRPPEHIKITGNDGVDGSGGYVFVVPRTDTANQPLESRISDGGYWNDTESFGGFFGDTRFVYGTGDNDYYLGTADPDYTPGIGGTFVFE